MPGVTLEQVSKAFPGGTVAVDGLSLEIADGEFMILVGSSGCGKTTALRMIAGLETPSSGTIRIGDRVVNDVSARDRDIAMVFQNYALYPHMTVARNLAYPLRQRRMPRREISRRVQEVAEMLDLSGLLDGDRDSSRAGSANAWRWAARSFASRRCSCSMSRCQISTQSSASRCAPRSSDCTPASTSPPSTSRTTRSRR